MSWVLLALISSFAYTAQTELNRNCKCDGFTLNTYRAVISSLIMLPILPFMVWPDDAKFYVLVAVVSAIAIICLMTQYNMASSNNGRVANIHLPVSIFVTFFAWLAVDEGQRYFLIEHPVRASLIFISFIIFMAGIQFVRKNDTGWRAFMVMLPIGVLYAVINIITKLVLDDGYSLFSISLTFVLLSNIMQAVMSLPLYMSRNIRQGSYVDMSVVKPSIWVSILHTSSWVMFALCMILTPNAAYPVVITALNPVWFMIYYRMRGIEDNASPIAGAVMVLSAIILVLAAN